MASERLRPWLLAPLVLVVWAGALQAPFTYDDKIEVVGNPTLRVLADWRAVAGYNAARPVLIATYAFNWAVGGLEPFGYHLVSLLIHALNAVLATKLGIRLLGRERGFLLGALWALHPLASEGVTYVTGRSDALCATAWLLALLAAPSAWTGGARPGLAAGAVAMGLLTKEVAYTLPFAVLLLQWLDPPGARRGRLGLGLASLLGVAGLVRIGMMGLPTPEKARDPVDHLVSQAGAWAGYLRLWLLPVGQSILHPRAGVVNAGGLVALGAFGLGIPALILRGRRDERARAVALGAGLWALWLLPSSALPLKEVMAEHRAYFAGYGLLLALVALLPARWLDRRMLLPLALLAGLTVARNRVWSSEVRLWGDAFARYPDSAEAAFGYGDALRFAQDWPAAEAAFRRALALDPRDDDAWVNLGIVLAEQDHADEAEEAWRQALRVNPKSCAAQNNLAAAELERGNRFRAMSAYERTLAWCPADPLAHLNLGNLAWDAGRMREAEDHLRYFLAVAPDHPLADGARAKLARMVPP